MADELNKTEVKETPEVKETQETKEVTTEVKPQVDPKEARNEMLREMSKEYGVNLFDVDGLKKFKEYQESQKTEQEKLQEELNSYKQEKEAWQTEKLKYQGQLKAAELGIQQDYLDDALKLAGNDPEKLTEVVKKYPIFKSKQGIKIGLQDKDNSLPPTGNTEAEAYMATDPRYKAYFNKTKK